MNYITDYQLDINNGFCYKIQNDVNKCKFYYSKTTGLWYINGFTVLSRALNICWESLLKTFTNCKIIDSIFYCNSKEQCYDICQYIAVICFKPGGVSYIKECSEKSRRYLANYYDNDQHLLNLPERSFSLRRYNGSTWYWHNNNLENATNCIYSQFRLSKGQVLAICNKLGLSCILQATIPTFENPNHAIKFTDYLIETYIIKKEKTYDTNQLRKERTSLRRGAKPTGNIIHGRRSKASVRCRHLEHKACVGC